MRVEVGHIEGFPSTVLWSGGLHIDPLLGYVRVFATLGDGCLVTKVE